jgi:hypothetical protein
MFTNKFESRRKHTLYPVTKPRHLMVISEMTGLYSESYWPLLCPQKQSKWMWWDWRWGKHGTLKISDWLTRVSRNIKLKSSVFWVTAVCSPLNVKWRFQGICRLHLQGWRISWARNQQVCKQTFNGLCSVMYHNHRCKNLKSYRT